MAIANLNMQKKNLTPREFDDFCDELLGAIGQIRRDGECAATDEADRVLDLAHH